MTFDSENTLKLWNLRGIVLINTDLPGVVAFCQPSLIIISVCRSCVREKGDREVAERERYREKKLPQHLKYVQRACCL